MEFRSRAVEGMAHRMTAPDSDLWRGRRVLITGHTGFKGAWLALWLEQLGAVVSGLALPADDPDAAFHALRPKLDLDLNVDIRDRHAVMSALAEARSEVVFHLAAQALVSASLRDPIGTYETNVLGTVNVMAAAVEAGAQSVVVVTSDKVYANDGSGRPFTEIDTLGGGDPYSASKACADIAAQSWRAMVADSPTTIAVARAGNVIGGGDISADRLLPDVFRAVRAGEPVQLRRPNAIRPWQFVLEPLWGYLLLAQHVLMAKDKSRAIVNFGPPAASCRPVQDVVELALGLWGSGSWVSSDAELVREASVLKLDSTIAEKTLGWRSKLDLARTVSLTVDWWRTSSAGEDCRALALSQIEEFINA